MRAGRAPVLSVGIIVFSLGTVLFAMQWMTQSNSVKVAGTIAAIEETSETDSLGRVTHSYYPQLWYLTKAGDTLRGNIYTREKFEYKIGDQVDIVYKKDNPRDYYRAKSFLWYFAFGAIAILGIGIMYVSSKMKSENWDD